MSDFDYQKFGEGKKTIIFLPGGGTTYKAYLPLINSLSDYYTVFALNLPGHGNATFVKKPIEVGYYVIEFLKHKQLRDVTIIGHSLGGAVALYAAAKSNLINELVLIDAMGPKLNTNKVSLFLKFFVLIPLIGVVTHPTMLRFYLTSLVQIVKNILTWKLKIFKTLNLLYEFALNEPQLNWKEIHIPVHIMWGSYDLMIPMRYGEELHQKLPSATFKVYKGSHDWCMVNVKFTAIEIINSLEGGK